MKRTVSALEARKRLGEILEDVSRGDEIVIERAGKPMAVVIPPARYQTIEEARQRLLAFIEGTWERNRDRPYPEVEAMVEEAIAEVRGRRKSPKSR